MTNPYRVCGCQCHKSPRSRHYWDSLAIPVFMMAVAAAAVCELMMAMVK